VVTPFLEIDFERDEVDRVAEGLSFLVLDVDEFEFDFDLSGSSDLLDRKERLSAGITCKVEQA
jgi:hypothetical protein